MQSREKSPSKFEFQKIKNARPNTKSRLSAQKPNHKCQSKNQFKNVHPNASTNLICIYYFIIYYLVMNLLLIASLFNYY